MHSLESMGFVLRHETNAGDSMAVMRGPNSTCVNVRRISSIATSPVPDNFFRFRGRTTACSSTM